MKLVNCAWIWISTVHTIHTRGLYCPWRRAVKCRHRSSQLNHLSLVNGKSDYANYAWYTPQSDVRAVMLNIKHSFLSCWNSVEIKKNFRQLTASGPNKTKISLQTVTHCLYMCLCVCCLQSETRRSHVNEENVDNMDETTTFWMITFTWWLHFTQDVTRHF